MSKTRCKFSLVQHEGETTGNVTTTKRNNGTGSTKPRATIVNNSPLTHLTNSKIDSMIGRDTIADSNTKSLKGNHYVDSDIMANSSKLHNAHLKPNVIATSLQPQVQHNALLKIEPFMLSLPTRSRRPFGRSYSTLSSTSTGTPTPSISSTTLKCTPRQRAMANKCETSKTPVEGGALKNMRPPAARHFRRHQVKLTTRQRSKSTSSSSASNHRPATTANVNSTSPSKEKLESAGAIIAIPLPTNNSSTTTSSTNQTNGGAIVTPQPNGVCRITRLQNEQEKLPDRINYDRRGLTAIPYFENEPNLRLLSLQHNLINVFHIPRQIRPAPSIVAPVTANSTNSTQKLERIQSTSSNQVIQHIDVALLPSHTTANEKSQQQLTPKDNTILTTMPLSNCLLNHSKQLQQKNLNFNPPKNPQLLGTQQQSQYRFALKKSKSFMINYSRQLSTIKRNMQKSHIVKPQAVATASTNHVQLKSFDLGGRVLTTDIAAPTLLNCDLEEEQERGVQLEIKNKQLQPLYDTIFHHLVFLDLYDNQIERIANLDGLTNLTVLLLGKNRINDIAGLTSLSSTLRVLDLHGNKITSIANKINTLHNLKSLNLAGNQIRQINQTDFNGLVNLKELNLKRNRIRRINGFQHLTALERLWLCHNDLHKVEDMASIGKATNLLEVTIENNPVSLAGDCVSFLVSYLPYLQSLSQMTITEQVRSAAQTWRKNKELSEANQASVSTDMFNNMRREEVISNARTNWELLRSQQTVQSTLRGQRSPKRTNELTKINEEIVVGYDELQEFIKLPHIDTLQTQLKTSQPTPTTTKNTERKKALSDISSSSSGSSLGPNVDSSSSCYSSDNEESSMLEPEADEYGVMKQCQQSLVTLGLTTSYPKAQKQLESCSSGTSEALAEVTTKPEGDGVNFCEKFENTVLDNGTQPSTVTEATGMAEATTKPTQYLADIHTSPTEEPPKSSHARLMANTARILPSTLQSSRGNASTPIVGGSNISLSLTLQTTSNASTMQCSNNDAVTSKSLAAAAPLTTSDGASTVSGKRYVSSSLIRAQTIVGSSSSGPIVVNKPYKQQTNCNLARLHEGQQGLPHTNAVGTNAVSGSNNSSTSVTATACGNKVASLPNNSVNTHSVSHTLAAATALGGASILPKASTTSEREREQGGDYLIEICGRYLNVYGQGALRFIDKQWNATKASDVHTLNFSYINFNNIATILPRIKFRFPNAENFVFRETNISRLGELNALAELQGITALFIDPEGNTITTNDLWRLYAVYRLSHWGLKLLNGDALTDMEMKQADIMYAGLSELVLWSMPDIMLKPLLSRLRLEETCSASKMSPKEWLMKPDNSALRVVVGKEALQWKKPQQPQAAAYYTEIIYAPTGNSTVASSFASTTVALGNRERGKMHFTIMLENTCNAVEKLHRLETLWPSLLLDIVRNTLLDYSQLEVYLRTQMSEIMK